MGNIKIKTILCPIDFSKISQRAVGYAADLCEKYDAQLVLLYVVENLQDTYVTYNEEYGIEMEVSEREEADRKFQKIVDGLSGIRVKTQVARGKPADQIAEDVANMGVDMVVMGTHGRSGIKGLFLGSVTQKVIQRVECPILAVK